jgi:hypothetical protein
MGATLNQLFAVNPLVDSSNSGLLGLLNKDFRSFSVCLCNTNVIKVWELWNWNHHQ